MILLTVWCNPWERQIMVGFWVYFIDLKSKIEPFETTETMSFSKSKPNSLRNYYTTLSRESSKAGGSSLFTPNVVVEELCPYTTRLRYLLLLMKTFSSISMLNL